MEETPSKTKKYEVFLSFRGVDTRNNITSHIYKALRDRNVETFMDDPDLRKGDEISPSLFKAIEESHISLVVFSKNYASSRWCLEELVKILQCKEHGQIVLPVFFYVEPTDVRNQTGSYAEAFAEFEASKKHLDKLQTWKDALKEAANHSGYSSLGTKPEALLVEKIVLEVSERLSMVCSHDNKGLIGIDSRINEIEEFLVSKYIRSVGIWGAGGIGKTTLAKAVFDKISHQFEGSCFLRNVRKKLEKGGLDGLEREFYGKITASKCIPNREYAFENRTLKSKKLLIVFDDVMDVQQIKDLISMEGLHCLDSRSRVIVTSRDIQVLHNCRVNEAYEMHVLSEQDGFKLFCKHANPPMWAYELSHQFVRRLGCLPLALQVIGCHLLHEDKEFWEESFEKLDDTLDNKVHDVLRISYDGLTDNQKNIFLDIVFFLNESQVDQIKKILNYYKYVNSDIRVLVRKSLIVVSKWGKVIIHDLLQDMGRMIERDQPIRTRLSGPDDIRDFHTKGQEIKGISLDMSKTKEIVLHLSTLSDIKILEFYCSNIFGNNKVKMSMPEGCDFVLNELRKFYWWGCPLKSFASKFHPEHLVTLTTWHSEMEKLWDGALHFPELKELDLRWSNHLTTCPNLSGAPNLEHIYLSDCRSLTCIPDCFAGLTSVKKLAMKGCSSLQSLPDMSGMESLQELNLSDCSSLQRLPDMSGMESLRDLNLSDCSSLQRLPDMSGMESLLELNLSDCSSLEMLPESLSNLNELWTLRLDGCSKLHKLPDNIGTFKSLREIDVDKTAIRDVPPSFRNLSNLEEVNFRGCELQDSMNSLMEALSGSCGTLTRLNLSGCGIMVIPDSLGRLSKLQSLFLRQNHFESIPESIKNLSVLRSLDVSYCKKLQCLPKLQSSRLINAANCSLLKWVHKLPAPYYAIGGFDFCFNNCVNLCLDEFKDVVEDFLQTLPSLATCSTRETLNMNTHDRSTVVMSYPESKMPEWFSHQCTGPSITLKLPRKEEGKIFLGFAVCVVIDTRIESLKCEYTLKSKDGQGHTFHAELSSEERRYHTSEDVECDHLYIGWNDSMYPTTNTGDSCDYLCYDTKVTFNFGFSNGGPKSYELKSCGVRPMYSENPGLSTIEFIQCVLKILEILVEVWMSVGQR